MGEVGRDGVDDSRDQIRATYMTRGYTAAASRPEKRAAKGERGYHPKPQAPDIGCLLIIFKVIEYHDSSGGGIWMTRYTQENNLVTRKS